MRLDIEMYQAKLHETDAELVVIFIRSGTLLHIRRVSDLTSAG